jgi:hypothetical protein
MKVETGKTSGRYTDVLLLKPEGMKLCRRKCRWKDNIKMDIREMGTGCFEHGNGYSDSIRGGVFLDQLNVSF